LRSRFPTLQKKPAVNFSRNSHIIMTDTGRRDSFSNRNIGEALGDFSNFSNPFIVGMYIDFCIFHQHLVWELHGTKSGLVKYDPNSTMYQSQKRSSLGNNEKFGSRHDDTNENALLKQALQGDKRKMIQEAEEKKKRDYPLWTELESYLKLICSTIVVNSRAKQSSPPTMMSVDGVLKLNTRERSPSVSEQESPVTVPSTPTSVTLSPIPTVKSPPTLTIPLTTPRETLSGAVSPSLPTTSATATLSYQSIITSNVFYSSVEQFSPEFRLSNENGLGTICSRHWSAMHTNPYMHIMLIMCDDADDYKNTIKPKLRDWVSYMNDREYEYIILYVPTSTSESLLKKISLYRVFDKLKTDFNDRKNGIDHVIKINLNSAMQQKNPTPLPPQQFKELGARIRDGVLVEFAHRCAKYEEEIKKFDLNRKLPGWQFCHYFIVKEGLAFTIEQFGLYVNALGIYSQLFSFYITQDDVRLDSFIKKKKTTKSDQVVEMISDQDAEIESFRLIKILDTSAKPYREMIYNTDVTEFDFYNYVFARQIQLFFKMNNPYEAAVHTKQFIPDMVSEMESHMLPTGMTGESSPAPQQWSEKHLRNFLFIHAWAYCTTQCVVEACQERAFETNAEVLAKLCRTLGDLYVFTRFQLQILSYVFGRNILFSQKPAPLSPRKSSNAPPPPNDVDTLPQSLKSPHLLPHIVELTRRFDLSIKNRVLDSIITSYDIADRLKQTVRSQDEFSKLYLELSSAAARGYSNGSRGRFYHCLNGEIAEIRFQQGNYKEAISLWKGQLAAYYADGWYELATEVRIKLAECERLIGDKDDDYINSCLSLLSHKYAHTSAEQKQFYYSELEKLAHGDQVLQSRSLSGEFIVATLHHYHHAPSSAIPQDEDTVTDGTDIIDPLSDVVMVDIPVGTSLQLVLQLHNITLPDEFTIDGVSLSFTRLSDEISDDEDESYDDEGFVIKHDQSLTLVRDKHVSIPLSTIVERRGMFELRRVTMHMGNLNLMIDRILLPGDRDYQQVMFRGVLPPSISQLNKLPKKFVYSLHEKEQHKKRKDVRRKELDEPVVEQSLDAFLTIEQPKFPKPLLLPQHALSLPTTPNRSLSNTPVGTPRSDISPRIHHVEKKRIKQQQSIASAPATTHTPGTTSIITPLSPNALLGVPSLSNLQITPQMGKTDRSSNINQQKLRINVIDSPSTMEVLVTMENGCLIAGEEQYMIVTIHTHDDVISEHGATLVVESITDEGSDDDDDDDDQDDDDNDHDNDLNITDGGMSSRREKREENEMTADPFTLELHDEIIAIPSLPTNTTHIIRVPVSLRKKSGLETNSNYCVMRTVRLMVSYQKDKIAPTEPLYVVSQVQPLAFFDPFVFFYNVRQWDDPSKPSLLQITVECTAPCPLSIQDYRLQVNDNVQLLSDYNMMRSASLMPEQAMSVVFQVQEQQNESNYSAELFVDYKISDTSPLLHYRVPIKWRPKQAYRYRIQVDIHSSVSLIRAGTPCFLRVKITRLHRREAPPTPSTDHRDRRRWWQVSADDEHWLVSGHSRQLFMIDRISDDDISHEFECPVIPVTSGYLPLPQVIIEQPTQRDFHLIQYVYHTGQDIENRVAGHRIFVHPDNDAQMGPFFPLDFPQQQTPLPLPRPHSTSNPLQPLTSLTTPTKKPIQNKQPEPHADTEPTLRHLSDVQNVDQLISTKRIVKTYTRARSAVDLIKDDLSSTQSTSTMVPVIEITPSINTRKE
jgi:hypothetical protein